MSDKETRCAHCNNPASQKCSACQEVYYCNPEHQRSHWKIHGKKCRPYKIAVNAQLGRHYIATKNIKVGEMVLSDKAPLVKGFTCKIPVCLGCFDVLTKDTAKPCRICGWPLCSNCTKHGTECEFTKQHRNSKISITEFGVPQKAYATIEIARALTLRKANPKAYQRLLQLEDHSGATRVIIEQPDALARLVKTHFQLEDIEEAEIAKIAGIIHINAYRGRKTKFCTESLVFDKSSYIEHNCRANCSRSITAEGGIIIWAALPISKGDHISISYVSGSYGTPKRQFYLESTKFFQCTCERCTDSTEFGTMFSVFRCSKRRCSGFFLQPIYTGPDNYPSFACRECNSIMSRAAAEYMEREMETMITSLNSEFSLAKLDACNKFAKKHAKILHENHFFKFTVDASMIIALGYSWNAVTTLSNQLLNDRIARCEELITLFEILDPSAQGDRGTILYTHAVMKFVFETRKQRNVGTISELPPYVLELKKMVQKSYELLYREPLDRPFENMIASVCLLVIQEIQTFEKQLATSEVLSLQAISERLLFALSTIQLIQFCVPFEKN